MKCWIEKLTRVSYFLIFGLFAPQSKVYLLYKEADRVNLSFIYRHLRILHPTVCFYEKVSVYTETLNRVAKITELCLRGFPLDSVEFTWTSISYFFPPWFLWSQAWQCLFVLFSVAVCSQQHMSDPRGNFMQWRNGASRNDKSGFREHPTLLSSSFPKLISHDKP